MFFPAIPLWWILHAVLCLKECREVILRHHWPACSFSRCFARFIHFGNQHLAPPFPSGRTLLDVNETAWSDFRNLCNRLHKHHESMLFCGWDLSLKLPKAGEVLKTIKCLSHCRDEFSQFCDPPCFLLNRNWIVAIGKQNNFHIQAFFPEWDQ